MELILWIFGISAFVAICTYAGYAMISEGVEYHTNKIKRRWVNRASRHIVKNANVNKAWATGYAESLYDDCSKGGIMGWEGWMDNPEGVVEEDMTYWDK